MNPEHAPTRLELLRLVAERPGASVAELARAAAVDHSTATYHLRRLERSGALVGERAGARLHWFVAGHAGPVERAELIGARLETSRQVLARVGPAPVQLGHVAAGLPMTRAGVYWHLRRLAALGLVVVEGPPRHRRYRAAQGPLALPEGLAAPAAA